MAAIAGSPIAGIQLPGIKRIYQLSAYPRTGLTALTFDAGYRSLNLFDLLGRPFYALQYRLPSGSLVMQSNGKTDSSTTVTS